MDSTAINAIEDLVTKSLSPTHNTVILPRDCKLESLEKYQQTPSRFRGIFKTSVINEFIKYVLLYANENSAVFIDHIQMSAMAIIDLGDIEYPGWAEHKSVLMLKKELDYQFITSKNDEVFTQADFIDFINDFNDQITFFNKTESLLNGPALKAIRTVKVDALTSTETKIDTYSSAKSALETVDIKSDGNALPTHFKFQTIPYIGFKPLELFCEIKPFVTNGSVSFKYRIAKLSATQQLLADQLLNMLQSEMKIISNIFIGNF